MSYRPGLDTRTAIEAIGGHGAVAKVDAVPTGTALVWIRPSIEAGGDVVASLRDHIDSQGYRVTGTGSNGSQQYLITEPSERYERERYQTLYGSVVDAFGEAAVHDRTTDHLDADEFPDIEDASEGVQKFEVLVAQVPGRDTEGVRDVLERAGYDVYEKPDRRYSEGRDPERLIVFPVQGADPLDADR